VVDASTLPALVRRYALYGIPVNGSFGVALLRLIPIVLSAFVAWWALRRRNVTSLEPVAMLSLLSLSIVLRLAFEVSLFGYYLTSVSVLLLLVQITVGRIMVAYIASIAVETWATVGGGPVDHGTFAGVEVPVWQLLNVAGAVYLAASPLPATTRSDTPMEKSTH
jgi:hypothetical protein